MSMDTGAARFIRAPTAGTRAVGGRDQDPPSPAPPRRAAPRAALMAVAQTMAGPAMRRAVTTARSTPRRAVRATPTTAPARLLPGRKPTGTLAPVRSTTPTPARPPTGARATPATIAMRTAAATSFRTGAAAGSNILPTAGRERPGITPGPIKNRRRAAPVMIG